MKSSDLLAAEIEAKRFLKKVKELKTKIGSDNWVPGGHESASVKRSSMDLTKSLAKLRKSSW